MHYTRTYYRSRPNVAPTFRRRPGRLELITSENFTSQAVLEAVSLGYNPGYTESVKTAVSMPDDLFRQAEAAARRLQVSRSEFYAKAIAEYLKRQQSDAITERLNEVYSRSPARLDPGLNRAQLKSLKKEAW